MPPLPFAMRWISSLSLLFALSAGAVSTVYASETADSSLRIDGRMAFIRPDGTTAAAIEIEIADTEPARVRGLMGREIPDFTQGMLFIFDREQILRFWMRNTPASLDMVFVAEGGEIVRIEERTTPMSDRVYSSLALARYVVEVKAGFAGYYGISPGTRIDWRRD